MGIRDILCFIPSADTQLWKTIKKTAEVELDKENKAVITQVVCMDKMTKGGKGKGKGGKGGGKGGKGGTDVSIQYSANVACKVNLKLGGTNLSCPELCINTDSPTMICAAAVSTAAPGQQSQTYASVVGSLDRAFGKYATQMCAQPSSDHHIASLKEAMYQVLQTFHEDNGMYPESLYFFRDALSSGQAGAVKNHEVEAIKRAIQECEGMELSLIHI
eukprot:TRINITY_DN19493_c0_g1_i1.p1 TRINITY_DN19493_c0_g1~~TRINITY_DN19493_c0_g1_i1.p1  ORF type:complete len:217 (-),score=82.44 TRINITY_DN19493_c0_g1_i1:47-697(-)